MKAKLLSCFWDFPNRQIVVQAAIPGTQLLHEEINRLTLEDVDIDIKKWRKKKSLEANAKFHVMCREMAIKLGTSFNRVKNELIIQYGSKELERDGDDSLRWVTLPSSTDYLELDEHLIPYKTATIRTEDGKILEATIYLKLKKIRDYDTAEMSHLIEKTIEECEANGIALKESEEMRRILNELEKHHP